jgi:SAM-dependent methyltransferase
VAPLATGQKGPNAITRTAYYDGIARQWHRATGHHGGALKLYVLNDLILDRIEATGPIAGRAILELGAGNGYLAPMLLRRYGGQAPARLVISDQSLALLDIAQTTFAVDGAEYLPLDVQDPFPFADASFDLILAIMLFNELPTGSLQHAAAECARVLTPGGRLLAVVVHPDFVHALGRKAQLTDFGRGLAAMPSANGLRLPVSRRRAEAYRDMLAGCGFAVRMEDVAATDRVVNEKPGLKVPRGTPLALLLDCVKG